MQATRIMVCLAAAAIGACASEPVVETAYYIPPSQEDPCGPNGCGGNSPVMDGVYFWKVHLGGLPSPDVKITGVHKNGVQMELQLIDGDRLRGVHPVTKAFIAEGTTLIGTRIALSVKGKPYELVIDWASPSVSFWVGAELPIWEYRFKYRPMFAPTREPYRPLCSEGDNDPSMLDAMVFGGDLYDPDKKKITTGPETFGWVNIACKDSAIYKMHRIGYTSAAQARLGIVTTLAQRHAMLNAWTSNVCGTGEAFTHQGEPITLRESLGVFNKAPYNAAPSSVEAIWGEDGAVCLNTHRLEEGLEEDDPEIYDKLTVACGGELPPPCSTHGGPWTLYGHVLTGNP